MVDSIEDRLTRLEKNLGTLDQDLTKIEKDVRFLERINGSRSDDGSDSGVDEYDKIMYMALNTYFKSKMGIPEQDKESLFNRLDCFFYYYPDDLVEKKTKITKSGWIKMERFLNPESNQKINQKGHIVENPSKDMVEAGYISMRKNMDDETSTLFCLFLVLL